MKIFLDKELVLELSETKEMVLRDSVFKDELKDHIKHMIKHFVMRKYESSLERLKSVWINKLKEMNVESIPLDDEKLANIIFSHKDYKERCDREKKQPSKIGLDFLD